MEPVDIKEVATRLNKPENTIKGYLRQRLLVWHEKDQKTGVKDLFYWPCVHVRQHFIKVSRDNDKNHPQIARAFEQIFGKKDQKLKAFLENHSTEQAIANFQKIFTEKGHL